MPFIRNIWQVLMVVRHHTRNSIIVRMACQAMLLDIQVGTVVKIGQDRTSVIIGLSKNDQLLCLSADEVQNSDIVVELCRIKHKTRGHWLIPSPYMPTSVNDVVIKDHALLNQGSMIKVCDRYMRYSVSSLSRPPGPCGDGLNRQSTSTPAGEMAVLSTQKSTENLTASTIFDPTAVYASMTSLNNKETPDLNGDETLAPDSELLQFLQTNDGLAHMTAAIVSQHVCLYTSLKLTAAEIDCLFVSFEHITTWENACFNTFLCEYEQIFAGEDHLSPELEGNIQNNTGCFHTPVIHLLTSLLRVSLDPIRYNILWLRILAVLSNSARSHIPLMQCKTVAAVLGCMAARPDVPFVQEHGCHILSRVADYKPSLGENGPIREGAIQLVVQAIQTHQTIINVIRNALCFLSCLTQTYARLAMEAVNTTEFASLEQQRDALVVVMNMLSFIEETVVPAINNLSSTYVNESDIQTHLKGIMSYFQDGTSRSKPRDSTDDQVVPVMNRESFEAHVVDHFNQTQDISLVISDVNSHPISKQENMRQKGQISVASSDKNSKRTKVSKKKVKFQKDEIDVVADISKDAEKEITGACTVESSRSRTSSSVEEPAKSRQRPSNRNHCSDHGFVKSGTGMLAFAVRTSKNDKREPLLPIKRTDSRDINQPLRQSIINGVEFFSDEEDMIRPRSNTEDSSSSSSSSNMDNSSTRRDGAVDAGKGDWENKLLRKPKTFVTETALEAGTQAQKSAYESSNTCIREKRNSILNKLSRKNSKPKKRFSILSTEYTQKQPPENVQLNTANLLFGVLNSSNFATTSDHVENANKMGNIRTTAIDWHHKPRFELDEKKDSKSNLQSSKVVTNYCRDERPFNLGTNISRYVNIFCNMSKRNKYKDTISIVSSEDSPGHVKTKTHKAESPQTVDFVQRTRKLFHDGKGKYDIAEAAIRASFTDNKVSGLSYIPLSLEEHGHDCGLQGSITFLR